jgi:hypothetical protein
LCIHNSLYCCLSEAGAYIFCCLGSFQFEQLVNNSSDLHVLISLFSYLNTYFRSFQSEQLVTYRWTLPRRGRSVGRSVSVRILLVLFCVQKIRVSWPHSGEVFCTVERVKNGYSTLISPMIPKAVSPARRPSPRMDQGIGIGNNRVPPPRIDVGRP